MKKFKQTIVVIEVALLIPSLSFASEYYTRTGTNKIIAEYIQSQIQGSTIAKITTKDDRSGFFGFITCLFDQWFDREADINELTIKSADYTTIIM
jgi:hypothetical protein